MKTSTLLKWITGAFEIILGIPFIGALIILSLSWIPLFVMLALHVVTLSLSTQEETKRHGSILGIITSVVAFIPIVGMIMHLVTGAILLADATKANDN